MNNSLRAAEDTKKKLYAWVQGKTDHCKVEIVGNRRDGFSFLITLYETFPEDFLFPTDALPILFPNQIDGFKVEVKRGTRVADSRQRTKDRED
jgi:hypothetical protein